MFDFFQPVINAGAKAFEWIGNIGESIEKNPEAWKLGVGLLGGAATGYMQTKTAKDQMKWEARMLEKKLAQDEKFNERRASSVQDNYGSHVSQLAGGTGLLAPAMYPR